MLRPHRERLSEGQATHRSWCGHLRIRYETEEVVRRSRNRYARSRQGGKGLRGRSGSTERDVERSLCSQVRPCACRYRCPRAWLAISLSNRALVSSTGVDHGCARAFELDNCPVSELCAGTAAIGGYEGSNGRAMDKWEEVRRSELLPPVLPP